MELSIAERRSCKVYQLSRLLRSSSTFSIDNILETSLKKVSASGVLLPREKVSDLEYKVDFVLLCGST